MTHLVHKFSQPGALEKFYRDLGVTVDHPVLRLPAAEQLAGLWASEEGKVRLTGLLNQREDLIRNMGNDPLRYGWEPDSWKDARKLLKEHSELLIMGGNRSAKTEFAAKDACEDLATKGDRHWAFFHSSADSSVRLQHPRVHKYLPPEWRDLGKQGNRTYVCFKEKTGFSDNVFILPNGSRGFFFNYMQDVRVLEGYELDGAWCDELVTIDFLEAIRYRLVTRRGRLIVTFTPVEGYTVTVGSFLTGATVVRTRPSPLLPGKNVKDVAAGQMPYELACTRKEARVLFFFTSDNLFNPYDEMMKKLDGASEREIKMRAYGWPDKITGTAFPKFGNVNILSRSGPPPAGMVPPWPWPRDPAQASGGALALYPGLPSVGTNYTVGDPGVAKNWFIKWYRFSEHHMFIYREWPDWQTHGPWAVAADKPDGKPGTAPRSEFGRGIVDYKRMILTAEGWVWDEQAGRWDGSNAEKIFERLIDPRMGGAEVPSAEEGTSLIALMEQEQLDRDGHVIGPSMIWTPAPGGRILDGLQLINDRLDYNQDKPVDVLNCPKMYVVQDCLQSIYALREYTGIDGEKGALKDIIDPDRYVVKADVTYVPDQAMECRGGGSY